MIKPLKKHFNNLLDALELGYRLLRGIDYQSLCLYILKINQHKDIHTILLEVSRCLKDILDYELFGFALKHGVNTDVWIDPHAVTDQLAEHVAIDCKCQKNDLNIHHFGVSAREKGRNFDTVDFNKMISFNIVEINFTAKLYILPKRRMLRYHDSIIGTIIRSLGTTLERHLNTLDLENAATIDPLTNCYNRRALCDFIESDIAFTQRYGTDLSVIMMDLDNFKDINDMYGHSAGDTVLKELARLITMHVRKSDYLARYGGEEFVLVLRDTPLYSAVQLAEKLRKSIAEKTIVLEKKNVRITASFGVASLENKSDHHNLLREADARLYKAKASGKNAVVPSLLPCFADKSFVSRKRSRKYNAANMR